MSTPRVPARSGGAAIQTPTTGGRRANGPPSSGDAAFRTPTTAGGAASRRTPGTAGGGHPSAARTPHALAARRALDSRRTAMFTPGGRQSRRKSGRMLRDSPRDILRNLSRRLAPTTQPVPSSSSSPDSGGRSANRRRRSVRRDIDIEMDMDTIHEGRVPNSAASARRQRSYVDILEGDDDDSDSLPLDRPRMSLPIEDDDNDDDLRPHRSTILENDGEDDNDADADFANFTSRSIELARRAATQDQLLQARRFSRASLGRSSFGSMRMSDYLDGYLGDEDPGADNIDLDLNLGDEAQSAFFPEGAFDNLGPAADATFERLDSETGGGLEQDTEVARREGLLAGGRESEFGVLDVPLDGNETTFMMGQQPQNSPDRTLGTVLIPGDGEDLEQPPLFGDYDDYGNENNGNMWEDEPDNYDIGADEDIARATGNEAAEGQGVMAVQGSDKEPERASGPRVKRLKLSANGIPYPSLPAGVIKRIAQTFAQSSGAGRAKLSTETVAALSTASDYFFEQVGVDLQRYAKHAGRKTIDESDMLLLMRRQRQVNATVTPFSLAQRFLPRELLQELRMIPDTPSLKGRKNPKPQLRAQRLSGGAGRIGRRGGKA
ncbi:histone-fold domain containing protein [Ophiostoma piceae UAMH 11346]|uniref:Histone-fold domain containing protein n=1 Tax=Ophiostoma piceae (strain UAMH 11346) TaxID=1262450 RepID=S3CDQ1_OPHP1|nr:histone-fold domain containing protein [Ophiostoma piceae UAMH 11346]